MSFYEFICQIYDKLTRPVLFGISFPCIIQSWLKLKQSIDPSNFSKCLDFLRWQSVLAMCLNNPVFSLLTKNQVCGRSFFLVFVVFGACRGDDLLPLNVNDIKDGGSFITVFFQEGKIQSKKFFTVTNEEYLFNTNQLIQKYLSLYEHVLWQVRGYTLGTEK